MPGFWFTSTVTAATPGEELRWSARLLTARLFLGEHHFTLIHKADGTTQVKNAETFSGTITRPFQGMFAKSHNEGGYVALNQALKSRVEARACVRQ